MPRATQLSVSLANKPGQLAKLAATMKRAKVNLLAISVVDNTDTGLVRLIADDSAKATRALARVGMKPLRQPVLVLHLPNEPGALAEASAKLAASGVNINYCYGSVARQAAEGSVVLGVDDLDKALRAA